MRWLLLACLLTAAAQADVPLVAEGQPAAQIVVAADALPAVKLAAQELSAFVERASGAKLPVVNQPAPNLPHVFLGASPWSAAAGVTPAGLKPEGFHLKAVGNDLHIVGDDSPGDPARINRGTPTRTGSLSGVYELLERVAGVRFFQHDELGTIVPKHASLTVPALDLTQAPHWNYRSLPYGPDTQSAPLYPRRLRLGQAWSMAHGHNWHAILPPAEYGEQHPEYFALVGGERVARHYSGHHGGQVCTTNPDVIEIFARKAIEYFDANPAVTMFSLSPNDGGGFCECDNCRALDVEMWGPENAGQPVMTDRMLTFYNAIAERVAARHPDRMLGVYVYSYYIKPPTRVRPHPSLALVFAVNSAGMHTETWAREQEWIRRWTELSNNVYQYDIFWLDNWSLGMPAPVTAHGVDKLKFLLSTSMKGGYLYIAPSYELLGPLHYLAAKLMWDPTLDAAALERDYYDGLYGPAGPDVKAWYDLFERRLGQVYAGTLQVDDPVLRDLIAAGGSSIHAGRILAAYAPVLDEADALLKRAAERNLDETQRQRLQRVLDHAALLRDTTVAYVGAEHLTRSAKWDADEVEAMKAAIERRADLIPKIAAYSPTFGQILAGLDQRETACITPTAAAYQIAGRSGPTVVYAPPAAEAPKVDGQLDAPWRTAVWRGVVHNQSGAAPRRPGQVALLSTATDLYLFVDGSDEDGTRLLKSATQPDNTALFSDDNIELFLVPPGDAGYYHLGVGAGGAVYTGRHPTGQANETAPWDPPVEAAVVTHEHGWRAELRLPLAALQPSPAAGAEGWKVNVYRVRRGSAQPSEYCGLAPTFAGHHVPAKFAVLRFAAPDDPVRFESGDLEGLTPERFERLFRPSVKGNATVELATDHAYGGANTVRVVVGDDSIGQVTLTAPARPGTAYRVTFAHQNLNPRVNPAVRPEAPMTRVIFRDQAGQAVTETSGYSWAGTPLMRNPGEWRLHAHTFTAPERTEQISVTVFLHHPGEYRLDDFRIEALK